MNEAYLYDIRFRISKTGWIVLQMVREGIPDFYCYTIGLAGFRNPKPELMMAGRYDELSPVVAAKVLDQLARFSYSGRVGTGLIIGRVEVQEALEPDAVKILAPEVPELYPQATMLRVRLAPGPAELD